MPSRVSLHKQEYYAHPRNVFWWMLGRMLKFDYQSPYAARIELIIHSRIAIWDVLHNCEREGSLDSNILQNSEQPNDFNAFLKQAPSLRLIAFNGAAAQRIYATLRAGA